ncbi:MAG TPA: hypothetical protein VGQ83_37350 [Polyangia bacterium]|jgi:hypothetical protein
MRRTLGTLLAAAAAVAAVVVLKTSGQPAAAQAGDSLGRDLAAYGRACADAASTECAAMHGAMRAELLMALNTVAAARDERGVATALEALDLDGEPAIHVAACRILAQFPERPGVMARMRALLAADSPEVQRAAAGVLESSRDRGDQRLARQWQDNHQGGGGSPYRRQPAVDLGALGFKPYPGAQRFAPGDAQSAAGFTTTDAVERVIAFYAAGAPPLDAAGFRARAARARQRPGREAPALDAASQADMAEMRRLGEEFQRTKDMALLRRLTELGQRLGDVGRKAAAQAEKAHEQSGGGVLATYHLPGNDDESPTRTARFVLADQRGTRVVRLVVAYREEALGRTVLQLVWDPEIVGGLAPKRR